MISKDETSLHLERFISDQIGRPYNPQKLVNAYRDALLKLLNNSGQISSITIEPVEETDDEKIVREVMEEPACDINLKAMVHFNQPISFVTYTVEFKK